MFQPAVLVQTYAIYSPPSYGKALCHSHTTFASDYDDACVMNEQPNIWNHINASGDA
jgi:hypothetical protein